MKDPDVFWRLEALSDRQLLERVGAMLGSSRRLMAELIAHLGEVEERRLHLAASCSSLFAYCLKLGMTEDEAWRRIEVARLARRYPAIFPLLAHGQLSISGVALLKHHLSDENHLELLAAATGKSVAQTRQLIAERFPRPDVASTIRKLPERRTTIQPSLALSLPAEPRSSETAPRATTEPRVTKPSSGGMDLRATKPPSDAAEPFHSHPAAPPPPSSRIEPLSAQRYKVQLTASAELARKLQLAKDLMRHSHPGGELGPIVERAVDLLIENLMQRRFGKIKKASSKPTRERAMRTGTTPEHGATTPEHGAAEQETTTCHTAERDASTIDSAEPNASMPDTADGQLDRHVEHALAERRRAEPNGAERRRTEPNGTEPNGAVWHSSPLTDVRCLVETPGPQRARAHIDGARANCRWRSRRALALLTRAQE